MRAKEKLLLIEREKLSIQFKIVIYCYILIAKKVIDKPRTCRSKNQSSALPSVTKH